MKTYNFVRFDGYFPRGDTKIGINKSGLIRLSSGFCRATNIIKFKYTVLFYEKKNKSIGLKFTNTRERGILSVTKDRTGATLSAKSFMKANNLSLKGIARRYDWEKQVIHDIGELFIIELENNETTN